MTRQLICGSTLVANGSIGTVRDGAVIVEDGVVSEVGPVRELESHGPFDVELGGSDRIIAPGFVNGHYHTECWTAPGLMGRVFELIERWYAVPIERPAAIMNTRHAPLLPPPGRSD